MNIKSYKKSFASKKALEIFGHSFFATFGFIALPLSVLDIFYPNTLGFGITGLLTLAIISFFVAIYKAWPKFRISRYFSVPNIEIKIEEGDLFDADGNLVIGMSDTFDTEKGQIIKPETIQGQFFTTVYADGQEQLDQDLSTALNGIKPEIDTKKSKGKQGRYPIGTVAYLNKGQRRYFCVAYSKMNNDFHAQSSIQMLTSSLDSLWTSIRTNGQNNGVAMAIIGSDTARLGHIVSYEDLIKLIVTSFVLTSREKVIAPSLTIYIRSKNREKINILEVQDFLQSF